MQGLRRMRKDRRYKTQEIADAVGVTVATIYHYEKGEREPNKDMRDKLCKFFNCKEEDLW